MQYKIQGSVYTNKPTYQNADREHFVILRYQFWTDEYKPSHQLHCRLSDRG